MSSAEQVEARCFAVRRSEAQHRLDCQFHLPDHHLLEAMIRRSGHPAHRIGDEHISSSVVDGPFGSHLKADEYTESGVPLIRVSNCRTGEVLSDDELVYISEEKHRQLIRSEVLPGDVLVTKAGSLGYAAVFPKSLHRGNITSHIAAIRPSANVCASFLAFFLASSLGSRQIYRWGNKATRPELNTDEVREILIPLPPLELQRELAGEMERARERRQNKVKQADTLFSSLDAFLMTLLGIDLPESQRYPSAYVMRLSAVCRSKQIGADYFHPERMNALRAIQLAKASKYAARLEDVADFLREPTSIYEPEKYLGLAGVQSNTGELTETPEEPGEGPAFIFSKDDVLFARLRPYLNKVWLAEHDGVCSTEFHVIRVKRSVGDLLPDYLAAVLRSAVVVQQTRHMMTGNTHPRLANEDVVDLLVPIPDLETQEEVVVELRKRRLEARRLRQVAAHEWEAATARFEAQLLG